MVWGKAGKTRRVSPQNEGNPRFMGFPGTALPFSEQMLGGKPLYCPGLPVQNSPVQQKAGAETRSGWSEI